MAYQTDLSFYVDSIRHHGDFAHGGQPVRSAAEWRDAGFSIAEMGEWLEASCFSARSARELANRGISPAQAGVRTSTGETVGYGLSNGDISLDEAVAVDHLGCSQRRRDHA